jgi:hypothetical protein
VKCTIDDSINFASFDYFTGVTFSCFDFHRFVSAVMNAIVSLCHFCEVHGPSVIMCTQAFHEPECSDHGDDSGVFSTEYHGSDLTKSAPKSLDCFVNQWKADEQMCKTGSSSAPSSPTGCLPDRVKPDICEVNSSLLFPLPDYLFH